MKRVENSSSSPRTSDGSHHSGRLVRVPLDRLTPHPANPNVMDEELLTKLAANVEREGDYEPIVVRPHPERRDDYEIINGQQRSDVLRRLGHDEALCYIWPCDDQTALFLLATLNRLRGQDDLLKRAQLLKELSDLASPEELARVLPEGESLIHQTLEMLDLDLERVLADLQAPIGSGAGPRAITFAVTPEDEATIEAAVQRVAGGLEGANRRGRALGIICKAFLEGIDG